MRHRFLCSVLLAGALGFVPFLPIAFAETAQRGGGQRGAGRGNSAPAPPHDPRDLSGIWQLQGGVNLTVSAEVPPRTPWGEAKFNLYKPSYGNRAVPPALGNDPIGKCDPMGLPRILFYVTPIEFIETPNRILMFFERSRQWRQIWMDGRELPKDPDSTWYGYSVGHWDGDTLVIESIGFDERSWLDHFGNPHSDQMRLVERWHRLDRDNLELNLTLTDPKTYTKPWVGERKNFRLQPQKELEESPCVPSEEEAFNKRIRDPAGLGVKPQ